MHQLKIERTGGLAGFGLPSSRIRSRGSVDLRGLSPADRQAIEGLFAEARETKPPSRAQPDAFQYHLTMTTPQGKKVVVVPEHLVPEAVLGAVQDELT